MTLAKVLKEFQLFSGLTEAELNTVAALCQQRTLRPGEVLTQQGDPSDELYILTSGMVEVSVTGAGALERVVVNLGTGQTIGEMSLVDEGPRSATVRATNDPTVVQVIHKQDFERLCAENIRIGFIVMRNIAADLSFRLRHQNLLVR
jgi:CRP-like cAMP-binding protein